MRTSILNHQKFYTVLKLESIIIDIHYFFTTDKIPKGIHSEETYSCQKNSTDNSLNNTYHSHNTVSNKQDLDVTTTPIQTSSDLKDTSFVNQLGEVEELDDCFISDEDIDKVLREDMESETLSNENTERETPENSGQNDDTSSFDERIYVNVVKPLPLIGDVAEMKISGLDDSAVYVNVNSNDNDTQLNVIGSNSKEYDKSVNEIYVNLSKDKKVAVVKDSSFNRECRESSDDSLYMNLTKTEDRKFSSPSSIDDEVFMKMTKTESGESFNTEDSSYSDSVTTLDKHPTALGYENIKTNVCDEDELYSKLDDADDSDKFSRFEDLFGPLTDIRFSGPGSSSQIMSTSFSESNDLGDDQDWDSGSDTRSSSSGEFIWKVRLYLLDNLNEFLIVKIFFILF